MAFSEMFSSTQRRRTELNQQSSLILDFCLRETRPRKLHYYLDIIAFGEKLIFQNVANIQVANRLKIEENMRHVESA